jgi:hypothetical protein
MAMGKEDDVMGMAVPFMAFGWRDATAHNEKQGA